MQWVDLLPDCRHPDKGKVRDCGPPGRMRMGGCLKRGCACRVCEMVRAVIFFPDPSTRAVKSGKMPAS